MPDPVRRIFCALFVCVTLWSAPGALAGAADGIRSVAAAERSVCAIRTDGALFCWGWNTNGQTGAGHVSEKERNPIPVFARGVTSVSVGYSHACAVVDRGLACWGWNKSGQVGNGPPSDAVLAPARIFEHDVSAVAAGGMHTCAIVGGALLCWGDNQFGELGADAPTATPLRVFESGASAVSAQSENTCAIVRGALWCWGDNRYGQVGNGTTGVKVAQPFQVFAHDVEAVAVGDGYACAIVAHALDCWGAMRAGKLHSLQAEDRVLAPETVIPNGVTAVAAGTAHACAIVGGALQCWGESAGFGGDRGIVAMPQTLVAHGVTDVAAAESVTCALVDGALRCRGFEGYGAVLTAGRAASQPFDVGAGDVRTLDRSAADAAEARARLPGEVASWLVGKRVTDGKLAYVVTHASSSVDKDIDDREAWTHMTLDVVALCALEHAATAGDRSGPVVATVPATANCGEDIDGVSRFDDHTPFLVLKDDRFVAIDTATAGVFAKLAPLASGTLEPSLRLDTRDVERIDACAQDLLARIARRPLKGIALYNGDTLLTRVPATPDGAWTSADPVDAVSRIVIEPNLGSAADYTADVRVNASMVCGDTMTLTDWKRTSSMPWQLERHDDAFEVNRAMLEKEVPDFPRYTAAELRTAIAQAKRRWNIDTEIDPSTCRVMLTDETYTIRRGDEVVQEIELAYGQPKPLVPFDCEGDGATFALHVAGDLGYRTSGWVQDAYAICKAMPDAPDSVIVVLAMDRHGNADDDVAVYDLDVAIVDRASRRVLARRLEKDAISSDAWHFDGLQIDTARYRLAANVRAFGVRMTSGGSSHVSPADETLLNLYVRDGKQLRKVLDRLAVHTEHGEADGGCHNTLATRDRTLDVAPSGSHGFADLIVTSRLEESVDSEDPNGADCTTTRHDAPTVRTTLRYDGRRYVLPAEFNTFEFP